MPPLSRLERAGVALALALAAAGLYAGWYAHWFLTDDAFIAFRFVDNRQLGFGYTWNPPPFVPVEGYTSFAWVVLLDALWSAFGLEPPEVANWLALGCAIGSLALAAWAALRVCALQNVRGGRVALCACVLAGVASQRSVAIWASSGMETALWNLLLQAWVLCGLLGRPGLSLLAAECALGTAAALTRPEGYLAAAASAVLVAVSAVLGTVDRRKALACAALFLPLAAHLAFRRIYYGEWLPNTYHAKVVGAWPEAGLRYLAAFVLEYGYYLALPLWLWALWRWLPRWSMTRTVCLAVPLGVVGFAAVIAGGDHFEYRALSFVAPLALLALLFSCLTLRLRARSAAAVLLGFAALSAVLPWTWFALQRDRTDWPMQPPAPKLADAVVWPLQPVAAGFDALQTWLLPHGVGVRWEEHRAFWLHQERELPKRTLGQRACRASEHPVAALATIGIAGWVLQGCAILDLRGLTDRVIARAPATPGYLGHDRKPPLDYVQAFLPNVFVRDGGVAVYPRPAPLTAERIRAIEREHGASP